MEEIEKRKGEKRNQERQQAWSSVKGTRLDSLSSLTR